MRHHKYRYRYQLMGQLLHWIIQTLTIQIQHPLVGMIMMILKIFTLSTLLIMNHC
nr:hypothetical protein [uncultured bacterium]